jgi:fibronectin type III domain protein
MRRGVTTLLLCTAFIFSTRTAQAGSITLAWDPNPEPDVAGYVLNYGTSPGIYSQRLDIGATTMTTLSSLTDGVVYYFAVAAYSTGGVTGPLSAEISGLPTPAEPLPIVISSLTADKTFPAAPGTTITWTTTATGGTTLEYQYWLWSTAAGWVSQPYSTSNRFTWTPAASDAGDHRVQVDVRSVGSSTAPVTQQTPVFTITSQSATVTSLTTTTTSPLVGVAMQWTTAVSGGVAPYQYEFAVNNSRKWTVVQAWGASSGLTWTPRKADTYQVRVRVRSAGVTSGFDSERISPAFVVTR